ncbi:hypothetical protein R3I94_021727 [Phoxinus phoxinus]|uniref:Uncharacterized protein n=1 Tax=Phoxinus phoxinus TaxID=58324 RepID=A0AAN9GU29_9TELE
MDFLSGREKDPLRAKYSTVPGWHSSHIYQRNPSTATDLRPPAEYNSPTGETHTWVTLGTGTSWNIPDSNKQTEISTTTFPSQSKSSHRELADYTGRVRREKQRSNLGRYKERDIHEQREGWESTWPINCRGKREKCGTNSQKELQAYANCYHHSLPKKTSGFEVGEWKSSKCASGIENVLGCGQWVVSAETKDKYQPTILTTHKKDKTDLSNREREQWRKWSTCNSRTTESIFPLASFRQPPSYTAPPAYSSPKDEGKLAGTPNVTAQESMGAFREQTFESRTVNSTESTETRCNLSANNGHYLQKDNQTPNTESYCTDLTGGQRCLEALNTTSAMPYTAITKPSSPQAQLQYRESSEITCADISQTKQTKLARRKGGEIVFCLVSRMGEVSGLSSSPEEPLTSHVLPLLTDSKPDDMTSTPQCNDDSRPNQDEDLQKDEAVRPLHGSLMCGEFGFTPLELTGGDQTSSSIQDFSHVIKQNEDKRYDSQSRCLTQKSYMETNGKREIVEKFPLWKEPKYQHLTDNTKQRNEQSQGINDESKVTNKKDTNISTKDQQKSLVVIDATCVVVKVELVLLPEKEHVQYVCLTEDRQKTDVLKQNCSAISSQETPENSTLDKGEERILGIPHEYPRTGLQTYESISQERVSSCGSNIEDPIKEFEESPSAAKTVDDGQVLENELMAGQSWSGTTLENNEGLENTLNIMEVGNQTTAKDPEATIKDFVALTNAESTSEVSGLQTEKTIVQINQATNQENGQTLDDSVAKHRAQKDNRKDTLPKNHTKESSIGETLSDEVEDREELALHRYKPLLKTSAENAIKEIQLGEHGVVLPSVVCFSKLRRSSSSPQVSFTSACHTLDGSHTENKPLLLTSSTNTKGTQFSSLPSLSPTPVPVAFENASLSKTRSMHADVLLCTSSPPEHTQHTRSLWDAVSRIRKHTAPDSETEEEEAVESGKQTDSLYQRLSTEEWVLEDRTSEKSTSVPLAENTECKLLLR